jgi:sugar phosphate isomerase/epimerase
MLELGYRAINQPSLRAAITEAKRNGFRVLEIHLNAPQFLPGQYSLPQRLAAKAFAQKSGIILQTHASLEQSLIYVDPSLRKGARGHLEAMAKFSRDIGARCLTLHPGKAAVYHTSDSKKLKDDSLYAKFYQRLFEDSIRHLVSIARPGLNICVENTDNFTAEYQRVLAKYLPSGKVFLTWDIRKNYTYTTNELIEQQWKFVQKNRVYVRNLHVSGFGSAHAGLAEGEELLGRFLKLFHGRDLAVVIEILPLEDAVAAWKVIEKMLG